MINRCLHYLTNRQQFASALFPQTTAYTPRVLTEDGEHVRRLLGLDVQSTDYYVVGVLGALYAFPEKAESAGPETRTFRLGDYTRAPDSWVDVSPVNNQDGPFVLRRRPREYPVTFNWQLKYLSDRTMNVVLGSKILQAEVRKQGSVLNIRWPQVLGVTGDLDIGDQSWDESFTGGIFHEPPGFPYQVLADSLIDDTRVNTLLLQQGLLEQYAGAPTAFERVATLALAVISDQA